MSVTIGAAAVVVAAVAVAAVVVGIGVVLRHVAGVHTRTQTRSNGDNRYCIGVTGTLGIC